MNKILPIVIFAIFMAGCSENVMKDYPIKPVEFTSVKINDNFWAPRIEANRQVSIPKAFGQCELTGRVDNFALAGGMIKGEHKGDYPFDDTDVYKVLEGASYTLAAGYDKKLDEYLDSLITIVAAGQEEDGYLYTSRTNNAENQRRWFGDKRWEKTNSHELYNCGHLYEAAAAHFKSTGKRSLLNVALKNADLISKTFGPNEGQVHQPSGHPIIEMGLVKLYRVTGDKKYLELANYFIEEAGRGSDGRELNAYSQDHKPVVEQDEAMGHAVRFGYFYSGITDVAALTQNADYIKTLKRVWENVTNKKLYLTGGIGSFEWGEGFGHNYELPNMTSYCETCAAISNVYWNHRMFLLFGESKYIDVLERALYNNVLSGISLSGDRFFYDNPLESDGVHERKEWFGCACCPSNVTRFMASVPGYVYGVDESGVFVNLFVGSDAIVEIDENRVHLTQVTNYPWEGNVKILVDPEEEEEFSLKVRIPGWLGSQPLPGELYSFLEESKNNYSISVNGEAKVVEEENGYATIRRLWKKGDTVEINFAMEVRKIICNEKVIDDREKFALQYGPIIYCAEGIDNGGSALDILLSREDEFAYSFDSDFLSGINLIKGKGSKLIGDKVEDIRFTAIPYYAWNNRGKGEMEVWFPYEKEAVSERVDHLSRKAQVTASVVGGYGPNDGFEPNNSADKSKHFFYWWTKKGTEEWIEYDFETPTTINESQVYWLNYSHYDVEFLPPVSWELVYKDSNDEWQNVKTDDNFDLDIDKFNIVKHNPVRTKAIRIKVKLQDDKCAGILEWRVF
ncbi:MAG: glycoside hydrolase family 127 protein [Bacteroidetes bacterium]|nr:glycoside hydrolase family 127 protein [Bacteroidota bacterium]